MDAGRFLGACASGDLTEVLAQAVGLEAGPGKDVLRQGLVVARMSGHQAVVEFLQPFVCEGPNLG